MAVLVRFGHLLGPVPNEIVARIRRNEDLDTHQHNADKWQRQPCDEVRIPECPCASLTGIFQAQIVERLALLLIDLPGRQNTVTGQMDAIG